MKPGQGKNKGSGFERDIGAKLSLWLSKGERKDLCCRTVGSGAQFTFSKGCGNPGDLMAQHPTAFKFFEKFVVECKFWKDIQFLRFLEKEGELYQAALKVQREAESKDKVWMLVARQNHRKTLLLMPLNGASIFFKESAIKTTFHMLFGGTMLLFYFDDFLKETEPETII